MFTCKQYIDEPCMWLDSRPRWWFRRCPRILRCRTLWTGSSHGEWYATFRLWVCYKCAFIDWLSKLCWSHKIEHELKCRHDVVACLHELNINRQNCYTNHRRPFPILSDCMTFPIWGYQERLQQNEPTKRNKTQFIYLKKLIFCNLFTLIRDKLLAKLYA